MTDIEVIIETVDGWMPHTRLYRIGQRHWLISVITAVSKAQMLSQKLGVMVPVSSIEEPPVEIYQASLERTPVYEWAPDPDTPHEEPPGPPDFSEDGLTATWTVGGQRWGGMHREQTGETWTVTAIDADGDPLNGLTPWATLSPGTTFEQALDHITSTTEEA